jgi:hypothetical protein
MMAWFATA